MLAEGTTKKQSFFKFVVNQFFMRGALKYIVDESGQKTSVLVPIKVWTELNDNYEKLLNKIGIFSSISEGLTEVRDAKRAGKKLQTLKEFLR